MSRNPPSTAFTATDNPNATQITLDGVTYPTLRAACNATGLKSNAILRRLAGLPAHDPKLAGKPVTLDGVTYPSRKEARAALGLTPQELRHRLKHGSRLTLGGVEFPDRLACAKAIGVKVQQIAMAQRVLRKVAEYEASHRASATARP